ncbi:MAG: hypothetical protein C0469_00090 [Cyanobacteria bacterium DS2.3.42]|nr:hypothetical protein [Cyanobacteria bacterium DS2.3.42]
MTDANTAARASKSETSKYGLLSLLAILASKGKLVLGALLKMKGVGTFITMVISMFGYWWAWNLGFWGAAGFVALIWIHEMGHVWAARKVGLPVTAPVFIPFLGALIRMKESPKNARDEAIMALGGPIIGSLGAFACLGIWWLSGDKLWLWLASTGMVINLFNLIPVTPLDGGRVATLFGPGFWWLGLSVLVVMAFAMDSSVLLVFGFFGLYEIHQRFSRLPLWVFLTPIALVLVHGVLFNQVLGSLLLAALMLVLFGFEVRSRHRRNKRLAELEYELKCRLQQNPELANARVVRVKDGLEILVDDSENSGRVADGEDRPEHDESYFNINSRDRALILCVYVGLAAVLATVFWWLSTVAALVN